MIIDVHCHLSDEQFDGLEIARKFDGIIIDNTTSPNVLKKSLEMFKGLKNVRICAGFFPDMIPKYNMKEINDYFEFIKKNKNEIYAFGEVGLDYHSVPENQREQVEKIFKRIIYLANELKKPLIVHSREAEKRAVEVLKIAKVPVIMHCFMGSKKLVNECLERGYYFSVNAFVFRGHQMKTLIGTLPIDRILTESDAPYISKEPKEIREVIKEIAKIKGLKENEVEKRIEKNFKAFSAK